MKALNKMTNDDVVKWLNKTVLSIDSARNSSHDRKTDLVDRYTELKDEAVARDIWYKWCNTRRFCPTHDGWDCFA